MKIKSILCALLLMVSSVASAQYLNVKLPDGTYHSYKTTPEMKVSFGEVMQGTEQPEQVFHVNGHQVTVKLEENIPASDVMVSAYSEGEIVKIKAVSTDGYGLDCSRDDNAEVSAPDVTNGFYTFELSNITKDMVVTIGYITVRFDLNNSNITDNFKAPADLTKMKYNSTIAPTYASAERHSFRGWYKDADCTITWDYSTDKVTKSMTLYAKWTKDPTETQINNHYFVKLGGYYWATENVGEVKDLYGNAMYVDKDPTYGYYYKYGYATTVAGTWNNGSSAGYSWTLPSSAQWQALLAYCDWTWIDNYNDTGKKGMLVTGRTDTYESGHSIFLPAAGDCSGNKVSDSRFSGQGRNGNYWSSTPGSSNYAYFLYFNSNGQRVDSDDRSDGYSVRAVLKEE